ncbi:hypothetical protein R1flu_001145 [Riccia fluitans]|uniref:Uncharacterized protein n=1 Tax=Riccia fluitans TaxID=41844 RepID=A0ABD1Y2G8_9MARC
MRRRKSKQIEIVKLRLTAVQCVDCEILQLEDSSVICMHRSSEELLHSENFEDLRVVVRFFDLISTAVEVFGTFVYLDHWKSVPSASTAGFLGTQFCDDPLIVNLGRCKETQTGDCFGILWMRNLEGGEDVSTFRTTVRSQSCSSRAQIVTPRASRNV